jgi:hypothetical protein
MRLPLVGLLLVSATASADPMSVGFRVGGYGFRRDSDPSGAWTECRMNGLGVFANRTVRGPLFVEAGLDTYFSINQPQAQDLPIDRQSALLSAAVGVRSSFTTWLDGYAQLGVGAELARLAVPYDGGELRDDKVMPDGFVGIGADIKIGRATHIGAAMRTLVMGNFNYDPQRLMPTNGTTWSQPQASQVFDASPGFAAQGQFYLRRDL